MSYKIISKFIKDISFEIPNAEAFVTLEKEISKYILKGIKNLINLIYLNLYHKLIFYMK